MNFMNDIFISKMGGSDCYLLFMGNIYGMMVVNILLVVVGLVGNVLLICFVFKIFRF